MAEIHVHKFPGRYFHPTLPPQWCETREDLVALLATDELWRDRAYTSKDLTQLRIEQARREEEIRKVEHANLLAEARASAALKRLPSYFRENSQVILRPNFLEAIVLSPGASLASVYMLGANGEFTLNRMVHAEDVQPDGSILPPPPLTPITGSGHRASPLYTSPQLAVPALADTEHRALPPSSLNTRSRSRRYADCKVFLEDLGYVLDAWRFYRPSKDPTRAELGDTPLPAGVIEAGMKLGLPKLWPLGMSRSALGKLLGRKEGHGIDLRDFMDNRPRPRRT